MNIGPVTYGSGSLTASVQMMKRSEELLMQAVNEVAAGDIVDAAMLIMQAKISAQAGVGVAKAINETQGMLLDILA